MTTMEIMVKKVMMIMMMKKAMKTKKAMMIMTDMKGTATEHTTHTSGLTQIELHMQLNTLKAN